MHPYGRMQVIWQACLRLPEHTLVAAKVWSTAEAHTAPMLHEQKVDQGRADELDWQADVTLATSHSKLLSAASCAMHSSARKAVTSSCTSHYHAAGCSTSLEHW